MCGSTLQENTLLQTIDHLLFGICLCWNWHMGYFDIWI